jgi:hypothetical protein
MIELILATALTCSEAQDLIVDLNKSRMEFKEDIIETIKVNTEPGCYEGSEHNS